VGHLGPAAIVDDLISTKLPAFDAWPSRVPGRRWVNGPTVTASPISASVATEYDTVAPCPTTVFTRRVSGPMTEPVPTVVAPSSTTPGSSSTSGPRVTVASM